MENKKITEEEFINDLYEYVGKHIELSDYTILNIMTYIQDNKIFNIIKYVKNNEVYSKKTEAIWKED